MVMFMRFYRTPKKLQAFSTKLFLKFDSSACEISKTINYLVINTISLYET